MPSRSAASLSISRLALLYSIAVAGLLASLWIYFWFQIQETNEQLRIQNETRARTEVLQAYQSVLKELQRIGDGLADWEETRQQLVFPDFYSLWRDIRVHDNGMRHEAMDDVALYGKQGRILAESIATDPLPPSIPVTQEAVLLIHDNGHEHVVYYRPIHADPAKQMLLGYLGVKMDLGAALRKNRTFRYANMDSLRFMAGKKGLHSASEPSDLQVAPLPDPDLEKKQMLFRQALMRQSLVVLGAWLAAVLLLRFWLVRPLRSLAADLTRLQADDTDTPSLLADKHPLRVEEIETLRSAFNNYRERLKALHGHLERKSQDFYDQAHQDSLSGAFNRRAFEEDWSGIAEDRRAASLALMLFDCDHFKAINDTYGHHVGDSVIQATAACLQSALRAEDRLYRLGGDEFAVLLRESDPDQAEMVAERCLEHICAHDFYQYGLKEPISLSIGIALSQGENHSLTLLQKRADLAMYSAKRPGSRKIVFYQDDMHEMHVLVGNREVNAVYRAVRDPACIEMAYQGVQRLPAAEMEYVEALVRVRYEEELLPPSALFPIVQSKGMDADFDLAVLHAIRRDMQSGNLPPARGVSINVSAPGIVNSKVMSALLDLVRAETQRKIVVEITETALITQMDVATAHIRQLREAGALVALDDFGSGYSSLRYLSSMPVDLVKFDISLVRMLESDDQRQRLITQEIASMVMSAGYDVVAEGIETRDQLDRIMQLGFSHAQGYLFGKPERAAANELEQ